MKSNKAAETMIMILVFFFISSIMSGEGFTAWDISTIATPDGTGDYDTKGRYASLGLDSNGKAHISYMKQIQTGTGAYTWNLNYITNAPGGWVETFLANSIISNSGNFISLTVDKNDKVHISFMYQIPDPIPPYTVLLYEASNSSGSWNTRVASSWSVTSTFRNNWTAIKTDSLGVVYIGYLSPYIISFGTVSDSDLMYATDESGPFQRTIVDSTNNVGSDLSLAIDSNRHMHISYYDAGNNALKYATNESGSWVTSAVDNSSQVGLNTSIGVDSNNKIHISYYDSTNKDLKYATNAGGSWALSVIDSPGQVGQYSSLAVDFNNKIHIGYYDATNGNLKYATNSGGAWVSSIVDYDGNVGQYASLAVGPGGIVYISYYDSTNRSLKYAMGTNDAPYRIFLPLILNQL